MKNLIIFALFSIFISAPVLAQSGGAFEIIQSVVAGGGGQDSAGGTFSLDGTVGQSIAGNASSNSTFSVTSGFWNFTPLAPTAASVGVGGRVLTANGHGIRNILIMMTNQNGTVRTTQTSIGGNYKFDDVEVGETYIFTVSARRFTFSQPTQIRAVFEETDDIDFIADN